MAKSAIETAIANLGALGRAIVSLASVLPAGSWFIGRAPPSFAALPLLTGAIGLAIVLRTLQAAGASSRRRSALPALLAALAVMVGYQFAFEYMVAPPGPGEPRPAVQIGFALAPWSLTEQARITVEEEGIDTPAKLLRASGYYVDGPAVVYQVWKRWTVILAASILISLFSVGYALWIYGCVVLARAAFGSGGEESSPGGDEAP